ncbi:MAG: PH domain-containing protein [Thermoprotei archaeon]
MGADESAGDVREIAEYLQPGEKVLVVARQSRWKSGGKLVNPGTVYATDRRLIIRDPYTLGLRSNITIIPYDRISGVRVKQGFLSTTLEFTAPGLEGGRSSVVKWGEGGIGEIQAIPSEKAKKIASIIGGYSRVRVDQPPQGGLVDQLAKLAELREKGAITDEEYASLKRRLIGEED